MGVFVHGCGVIITCTWFTPARGCTGEMVCVCHVECKIERAIE